MLNRIRIRRAVLGGMASALAIVALPGAASAADLTRTCGDQGARQVFAPFGDKGYYTAVQDGGFEASGAGWQLDDGATVVDGNESFYLGNAADSQSLSLPDGASATSPPTCAGLDTPKFRFILKGPGSSGTARLKVEVVYLEVSDKASKTPGVLAAEPEWATSPKLSLGLTKIGDTNGDGVGTVAYRFTAVGGDFSVDDVYTDPRMRR